jgi:hypothetical protein
MNEFIAWINEFNQKLGLEYSMFDWTRELDDELVDVQCSFGSTGKTLAGRGTDKSKESAIVKATAECLERYFLDRLTEADSSNGVAIHTERQAAELNALFELLERDAFFCHFLTKIPFSSVDDSKVRESALCSSILDLLKSKGAEIRFGQMRTDSRFSAVICAIFGAQSASGFGMTLGTCVKRTLEESIESALLESARSAVGYLSMESDLLTALRKSASGICSAPEHHLLVGLDPIYAETFKRDFFDNTVQPFDNSELDLSSVSISTFMPLLDENSADMNPPLYFSRACSSDLLNLYFGDFVANEKNLIRLGKFLGRVVSYDDINKDIHPFG